MWTYCLTPAIDAAASELFHGGRYQFRWSSGEEVDSDGMIRFWADWVRQYPISSLEDPLDENDWAGWTNRFATSCVSPAWRGRYLRPR